MNETHCTVGAVTISRVTEQVGPGFPPEFLFPDWDPAVLDEGGDWTRTTLDPASGLFVASIHSWIVRIGDKIALVDTCAGNDKPRPGIPRFHMRDTPFLDRLAAAGVTPEQVDYVLCTHLHADHCGWNTRLLDGRWVPTFPNARYIFSRAEHDHWQDTQGEDELNTAVYQDSVLPVVAAGLAELVDDDARIAGALQLRATPGHTPGHVAVSIASRGATGLFTGDIMHQPAQVVRPDWNSRFCVDADAARASRLWALETAAEQRSTLFSAHFPQTSAGMVARRGDRFGWTFAPLRG
jgi:glyoxylase-like metal-dependent hydrolase (beta-lactamase superfamily II)